MSRSHNRPWLNDSDALPRDTERSSSSRNSVRTTISNSSRSGEDRTSSSSQQRRSSDSNVAAASPRRRSKGGGSRSQSLRQSSRHHEERPDSYERYAALQKQPDYEEKSTRSPTKSRSRPKSPSKKTRSASYERRVQRHEDRRMEEAPRSNSQPRRSSSSSHRHHHDHTRQQHHHARSSSLPHVHASLDLDSSGHLPIHISKPVVPTAAEVPSLQLPNNHSLMSPKKAFARSPLKAPKGSVSAAALSMRGLATIDLTGSEHGSSSTTYKTTSPLARSKSATVRTMKNLPVIDLEQRQQRYAMELGGDNKAVTSRELRNRRLAERQQRRGTNSSFESTSSSESNNVVDTSIMNNNPLHFQAHSPAVEQYLKRQQMMDRIRSSEARHTSSETTRKLPPVPPAAQRRHSPLTVPKTLPIVSPPRAHLVKPPEDETHSTLNSNVAGWSTLRLRQASSEQPQSVVTPLDTRHQSTTFLSTTGTSRVDQYLASRQTQKQQYQPLATRMSSSSFDQDDFVVDTDPESESEEQDNDSVVSSASSSSSESDSEAWSVRICVVSAVDFPASVVPNLPLSPVLKVGLVKLLNENPQDNGESAAEEQKRFLAAQIEKNGLGSIPKARIRCTSSKVLSKRDNGSVEFHEEMRWDRVRNPEQMALALELSSRAVMTPANIRESPPAQKSEPLQLRMNDSQSDNSGRTGIGGLFRNKAHLKKANSAEMETANAAAAVAKLLVEEDAPDPDSEQKSPTDKSPASRTTAVSRSELDVRLRPKQKKKRVRMTEDLPLGAQIIPLSCLSLEKAMNSRESARVEQWFQLEQSTESTKDKPKPSSPTSSSAKRNPSILLEISFAAPEILDESEDDLDEVDDVDAELRASFSKRASIKIRNQLKQEVSETEKNVEEPAIEPGIIDFSCVVGARDIGDQKADDGARGWVNTRPECVLLERFPPDDEFHVKNGRHVALANKIEWFCFPEGVKLWRGTTPPNAEELNLKRFSASSPPVIAASTALFDACLGCTSSFSWFVIASNSEEYGSLSMKTYGAVIRFYVAAPAGIDPTQDDFAQTFMQGTVSDSVRLWVPLAICLTSNLPIVGTMEAILFRMCDELATKGADLITDSSSLIRRDLVNMIVNFQKPIPGVVNSSVPFLSGERFHVGVPSQKGLPPLPHGNAVSSVCRLLGAEGLNSLLAALLTECKILLHSDDVANLCLVAEVMTALLYPFQWSLPYVPVLPNEMMEFIEAPLSYLLGVPSCNMNYVDPAILEDVVVIDLDREYASDDVFEGRRTGMRTKLPTPLPASVASNISKAVYRLLRVEEDVEDSFASAQTGDSRMFPRLEPESLPEREFRIAVALEVCGLVKGLQECLVYTSSSQPVFNVDKFLQTAPVMFEDQRGTTGHSSGQGESVVRRVVSPRSRRFMSLFVQCQHFYQFLEMLDHDQLFFFREVMNIVNTKTNRREKSLSGMLLSLENDNAVSRLAKTLRKLEDIVPTFRVSRPADEAREKEGEQQKTDESVCSSRFPFDLLQQIVISEDANDSGSGPSHSSDGVKQVSLQYLVELEKNPWRYQPILDIDLSGTGSEKLVVAETVKLRDAIGERRYRAWQMAQTHGRYDDEVSVFSEDGRSRLGSEALDLTSLVTSATDEISPSSSAEENEHLTEEEIRHRRIAGAKDRDILRRCLEQAGVSGKPSTDSIADRGRDLVSEAEVALQNPAARRFLVAILSKRSPLEGAKKDERSGSRRVNPSTSSSKLGKASFEVLVRLGCAMLDSCMESSDYESAYSLLKLTAGLYTTTADPDGESSLVYLTGRIGLHPVFADLGLWEMVKNSHLQSRQQARRDDGAEQDDVDEESDEYEATIATLYEMVGYGIPAEELARFASRISERNFWFKNERGQALLMLARRLCVRREQGEVSTPSGKQKSDLEMMSSTPLSKVRPRTIEVHSTGKSRDDQSSDDYWVEVGWCHPAAKSSRRLGVGETASSTRRPGTQNLLNMLEEQKLPQTGRSSNRMKRTAVTTMAYLGSSVIATGGLDGGVFLARKVRNDNDEGDDNVDAYGVRGLHLDWGSSGSRYSVGASSTSIDGEYGVGAVSCLAATRRSNHSYQTLNPTPNQSTKDVVEPLDDDDLVNAMDGCRIVAGTTCGDLRVWSVKDVLSAVFYTRNSETTNVASPRRKAVTDFAAGSSLTRLKFSLRGRALSGHRGGVSCVDVPSNTYRPDSIVSGGADGLIKLWSLRAPSGAGRSDTDASRRFIGSPAAKESFRARAGGYGDALSILSGHGGRILCIKTAWHGDRLLSGGADRIVRIWDIAGSGGKCLNSLSGHFGWVTAVRYWGPNTIISASTDRSIALWDARIRNSPLFALRHHYAPVSDLLVGSRTDPIMVSSALDGTVAAWDFRHLSGPVEAKGKPVGSGRVEGSRKNGKHCKVIRDPVAQLYMRDFSKQRHVAGPVLLSKGTSRDNHKTVFCVGCDATLREWDIQTGQVVSEHVTGHCDTISSFCSLEGDRLLDTQLEGTGHEQATATITSSWDGTVRFRTRHQRDYR